MLRGRVSRKVPGFTTTESGVVSTIPALDPVTKYFNSLDGGEAIVIRELVKRAVNRIAMRLGGLDPGHREVREE